MDRYAETFCECARHPAARPRRSPPLPPPPRGQAARPEPRSAPAARAWLAFLVRSRMSCCRRRWSSLVSLAASMWAPGRDEQAACSLAVGSGRTGPRAHCRCLAASPPGSRQQPAAAHPLCGLWPPPQLLRCPPSPWTRSRSVRTGGRSTVTLALQRSTHSVACARPFGKHDGSVDGLATLATLSPGAARTRPPALRGAGATAVAGCAPHRHACCRGLWLRLLG